MLGLKLIHVTICEIVEMLCVWNVLYCILLEIKLLLLPVKGAPGGHCWATILVHTLSHVVKFMQLIWRTVVIWLITIDFHQFDNSVMATGKYMETVLESGWR